RSSTAPFLLRLFWRQKRALDAHEFSLPPPPNADDINDFTQLLPSSIRQQSVQIYTWPTCTLSELTGLLTSVLPAGILPSPSVGTRLVFKLIFPDTRAQTDSSGRGKWSDRPLGTVVIGGSGAGGEVEQVLEGDAEKELRDARFVIGDYVACAIYPPGQDGRVAPMPGYSSSRSQGRGGYDGGFPPPRANGFGGGGRGGYGRGGGRSGGFGQAPPLGDWRRGERPPGPG
ncbi:hypothetical protein K431DRAFT_209297, partial [Polychaeton citri CBS 116435]